MKTTRLAMVLIAALPATGAAEICVENGSASPYLFVAEARPGGGRVVRQLAPDERLCSTAEDSAGGVVSVFESHDSDEGCSRLVPPGGTDRLLRYASFDRCRWASHDE